MANCLSAIERWQKTNTRCVALRFNVSSEKDIISRLDEVGNKNGYIKSLIRADIKKQKRAIKNGKKRNTI